MRNQVARNPVSATSTRNLRKLLIDVLEQAAVGGIELGIGERIRRARMEAGLTQDQLADAIGVKMRQVQYYEADRSDPYRKLARIAEVTGKPVEWLRGAEEPEPEGVPAVLLAIEGLREEVREIRGVVQRLEERLPPLADSSTVDRPG